MIADHWPLYRLVLRTPRLELRLPDLDRLSELADVAAAGVHDPAVQPFAVEWTDGSATEVARAVLRWHWRTAGQWSPESWSLNLVAIAGGRVVGTQSLDAVRFATLREVGTGSWLGREFHGHGFGTEMRAAVLELAFAGLGARHATSEAFAGNHASYGVSRKLGYADDGIDRHVVRGEAVTGRRLRLTREEWTCPVPVEIEGLDGCRDFFGR